MFNRDVFYRQLDDVYERRDIDAIEKFLLDTLRALAEERAYNTPSCDLCITPADRISLNSGYLKNLLTVQNELLSLYRGVNRFDECLRISSVMKEEMTELDLLKTDQYAILLLNEGTAYRMMGRTGDALKDFDECDGILQNVRGVDPFTVASLYNNRAPVLLQQARTRDTKEAARSDYEKALEDLRKALEIVRRIGNLHREEAVTLCGIAEICSLLGDDAAGESAADQAVALYKTAGTDPHEGAGKYDRVDRVVRTCLLYTFVTAGFIAGIMYFFRYPLLRIYNTDPAVVEAGVTRLVIMVVPYFLYGMADVFVGAIRGTGHALSPVISTLLCTCLLRILWTLWLDTGRFGVEWVYYSFPVTWFLLLIVVAAIWHMVRRKAGWPTAEGIQQKTAEG